MKIDSIKDYFKQHYNIDVEQCIIEEYVDVYGDSALDELVKCVRYEFKPKKAYIVKAVREKLKEMHDGCYPDDDVIQAYLFVYKDAALDELSKCYACFSYHIDEILIDYWRIKRALAKFDN